MSTKRYLSVDIEASGATPGKYSMLSLGACVVGKQDESEYQFYREIKPISNKFNISAMRVAVQGLRCLDEVRHLPEFNHESPRFNPASILEVLKQRGETPQKVMADYADWLNKVKGNFRLVEVGAPIKFDGMFTAWYFDNFYEGENLLGFSGDDINSLYRGAVGNLNAHVASLGFRRHTHNALGDAIDQAKELESVLKIMTESQK